MKYLLAILLFSISCLQGETIKEKDGTTIQVNPDGSKKIQKPDGTLIEVHADGTKSIRTPNGTTIEVKQPAAEGRL